MEKGRSTLVIVGTLILAGLVLAGVIYYAVKNQKSAEGDIPEDERSVGNLSISANNNTFTPSDIRTELFSDLNLRITAVDRDYEFKVVDYPRFDKQIPMGETAIVQLYSLGVGEYSYTCGDSCTGRIVVSQQSDSTED